jgi:hypothetical protein
VNKALRNKLILHELNSLSVNLTCFVVHMVQVVSAFIFSWNECLNSSTQHGELLVDACA